MTTDVSAHMYVYLWEKIEKGGKEREEKGSRERREEGGGERGRGNENIELNFLYK